MNSSRGLPFICIIAHSDYFASYGERFTKVNLGVPKEGTPSFQKCSRMNSAQFNLATESSRRRDDLSELSLTAVEHTVCMLRFHYARHAGKNVPRHKAWRAGGGKCADTGT